MQREIQNLTRLDNAQCLRDYGQAKFLTKWRNLLLVTDAQLSDGATIVNVYSGDWTTLKSSPDWPCSGINGTLDAIGPEGGLLALYDLLDLTSRSVFNQTWSSARNDTLPCNVQSLISGATSWTLTLSDHNKDDATSRMANVRYCLAQSNHMCSILVNTTLLWIVVACNAIKIICLCSTLCTRGFRPLVTIGDAVESFLVQPEAETEKLGPISVTDIRQNRAASLKHIEQRRAVRVGRSRANVASRARWTVCMLM